MNDGAEKHKEESMFIPYNLLIILSLLCVIRLDS